LPLETTATPKVRIPSLPAALPPRAPNKSTYAARRRTWRRGWSCPRDLLRETRVQVQPSHSDPTSSEPREDRAVSTRGLPNAVVYVFSRFKAVEKVGVPAGIAHQKSSSAHPASASPRLWPDRSRPDFGWSRPRLTESRGNASGRALGVPRQSLKGGQGGPLTTPRVGVPGWMTVFRVDPCVTVLRVAGRPRCRSRPVTRNAVSTEGQAGAVKIH